MGVCGIIKIILYDAGVVMCYDQYGYQSISMQGIFSEVVDRINTVIKPNDVKWFYVENGVEKEISHTEWMKYGANLTKNNIQPEVREISAEDLSLLKLLGNVE
jgi:hypothetical protein